MSKTHILIAEDDINLRQGLCDLLEAEGYRVTAVADGAAALNAWQQERPGLALLDVMMPEKSGFDVCREIRRTDALLPIILLTAKGEEIDKVIGLELGADDYITKPFGLHELRARIAAVLRRAQAANGVESSCRDNTDCFAIGSAQINRKTYEVELDGKVQSLSGRELTLLDYFVQRRGEVISRNDLLNAAWGVDYYGTTRTLDQHIAQLRKKIEPDPASPRYLLTVHGIGYKLSPPTG
ncbi:MAG: DNA-binding response regulator [Desulfuromonas sp.]|nr:MAG: DNA-binding response regulator [Desulfuromonas sp.]